MKKNIKVFLFALMAAVSFSAMAENSFVFYIDNLAIKAGEKKQVELKMKNNFLGRDFQMEMILPEGLEPVMNEDECYFDPVGRGLKTTYTDNYIKNSRALRLLGANLRGKSVMTPGDEAIAIFTLEASENYNSKNKILIKGNDYNKLNWAESVDEKEVIHTVVMTEDMETSVYPAVTLPWLIANGTDGAEYGIADPVAVLFETTLGAFVQDADHTPMRVVTDKEWGVLGCAAETMMGVYSVENGNPCLTTFKGMPTPKEDSSIEPAVKQTTLNNVLFAPEANEVVAFGGYMRASDNAVCAYPGPGDQGQCITLNWSALMARAGVPTDGSYFQLVGPVLQKMVWEEAEETQGMTGKDGPGAWKNYVVYPVEINTDVPTGVNDVNAKTVAGVKYVNAAGVESSTPFDGINIVVTSYTDGTMSAVKVVK